MSYRSGLGVAMAAVDRTLRLGLFLGMSAVLGATVEAVGADLGSGPPVRDDRGLPLARPWTLSFTPYGWLSGLSGDTTVKGRTADIDVGPFTVLEHLDGVPWMSYAELRVGRFALYNDIFYAPLGVDADRARSFDRVTLDAALGVDIEQAIVEIGAVYEVARFGSTAFDLLAGARYWRQEVDINLALTATIETAGLTLSGGRAIARGGVVDWIDPLIGLRVRHQLAPGQELLLRGDVGGFGAGSEFSWNVLGAYSFQIGVYYGTTVSGMLGYRALSVDFEKGSGVSRYEYDVVQHGPIIGLTLSF
jgi:hypothetical protein